MGQRIPLPLLPGFQEFPSSIVCEQYCATVLSLKVFRPDHSVVDQGQHKPICHAGPQLLHQVQRQGFPPGTIPVEKAHIGIQPNAFQRAGTVVRQQAVGKGQHGVDPVKGWTAIASPEIEVFLPAQQQMVEHAKIRRRPHALQPPEGFHILDFQNQRQQFLDFPGGILQTAVFHSRRMIPKRPLNACPGVVELPKDHIPGNRAASL